MSEYMSEEQRFDAHVLCHDLSILTPEQIAVRALIDLIEKGKNDE